MPGPRLALSLALLALAALPVASAQMATHSVDLALTPPKGPVEPGEMTSFTLAVRRTCSSPAMVLPEQTVELQFRGPGEVQIGGPMTVSFPQHPCALPGGQSVEARYDAAVSKDAEHGRAFRLGVVANPGYTGNPLMLPGPPAAIDFLVATTPAPEPSASAALDEAPEQEAPSPAAAVLVMALLGAAAFVARRRE